MRICYTCVGVVGEHWQGQELPIRRAADSWHQAAPVTTGNLDLVEDAQKLLMLVEDNGADVFLVEQALEFHQLPFHLRIAEDGEVACKYFDQADADPTFPCPDILLLDLNLPKRSGAEVLERVRNSARCGQIPVIVLTSSDSPEDRQRVSDLGADRYFRKPTSYREFMQIGEILKEVLAARSAGS